ncbi:MAG: AAA family ATPase [Gordonibacter sp.]|nr:AAA family ATPase [Gordonibacter sp.]
MSDGLEQWRAEALEAAEVEGGEGMLPSITRIDLDNMPELRPELIEGVLRVGHVMMVGGASKVGKTFLLIELALAIATGGKWLGMNCRKGRVLYVNLEVDSASFLHRCKTIIEEWQLNPSECMDNVGVWNLRGHVTGMESFTNQLIDTVQSCGYEAVIIDPTYKVMDGDENAAKDVRRFTNELDRIASQLNIAVIYCAHHSKGAQGDKRSIDRVSGSGVFSRHGDAIFDLIELKVGEDERHEMGIDDVPCFRVAITLRDFKSMQPFEAYFKWPKHIRDYTGALSECPEDSQASRGGEARRAQTDMENRGKVNALETVIDVMREENGGKPIAFHELVARSGYKDRKTVRRHLASSKRYEAREIDGKTTLVIPVATSGSEEFPTTTR